MRTHPLRRFALSILVTSALSASGCGSSPDPTRTGPDDPPTTTARNGVIAFARLAPDDAGEGLVRFASLAVLRPDGRVRRLGAEASLRSAPAWSPDGGRLAFVGRDGLELLDPRGGERRLLIPCDPLACTGLGQPAWSPDGDAVAFFAEREGSVGLWAVPAAGGEPSLIAGGLDIVGAPSFAPDGGSIAVIVDRGAADELVLLDPRDGAIQDRIAPEGLRLGETVAWSPDGATLAVAGRVDGAAEGVYLMAPDGSGVRLLTSCPDDGCVDVSPAWSPDGVTVVFTRGRCDRPGGDCFEGDLLAIPATGGRARVLTEGALDCCAAWQPIV
jgi:Tol biopolymer transport system component